MSAVDATSAYSHEGLQSHHNAIVAVRRAAWHSIALLTLAQVTVFMSAVTSQVGIAYYYYMTSANPARGLQVLLVFTF